MVERARRELDDARTELRALRNEEQRAAMLEDELRSTKAELESRHASFQAELVERESEFEEKVRDTRESFQRQIAEMQTSYEAQLHQAEAGLADRIAEAEATARRAAAELETVRVDLDGAREEAEAARSEAASREQRVLQGHDELQAARQQIKTLEQEIKERSAAVTQAHKEADDVRRSLLAAQADLSRTDGAVDEVHTELEQERQRAEAADQAAIAAARERDALQERVDKLIRQLDDAAADNQEVNRRLQDFEARRQLELADDPGRTQIDELLRVTQERLAGQTEKLIATEDRVKELESGLTAAAERADLAEAENRTHQMSEALREMREHDVATTRDATTQREISAATSAAIEAGALEDRRATSPLLKELSMDAKKSLAKIDGITKLMKHKKDPKDQAQLMKQLATFTRRLDHTVGDIADAENLSNGTVELAIKRTDMEALINRVVEESGADADNDIRVVADALKLRIDASRTEQIMSGLLRTASERTQNGKTIVVRLQHVDGGAIISVEDPGEASDAAISPVVRRFAEIQGGWIKAEALDGGGAAFRVFLPDGAGTGGRPRPRCRSRSTSPRPGPSRRARSGRPRPRTRRWRPNSVAWRSRATRSGRPPRRDQTRRRISASPCPPPPQIAAPPSSASRRCISNAVVRTIRAPLAPIGWPRATAPPFGFTIASSTSSMRVACTATPAKASLTSSTPRSAAPTPTFLSALSIASAGTVCSDGKRSADMPYASIRASGDQSEPTRPRPRSATTTAQAPSLICDALPAVTVPSGVNAGGRPASASDGRVGPDALVARERDGLALALRHRDGHDFAIEAALVPRGRRAQRATGRPRHPVPRRSTPYSRFISSVPTPMCWSSNAHQRPSWIIASSIGVWPRRCPARALGSTKGAFVIDSIPPATATSISPARII